MEVCGCLQRVSSWETSPVLVAACVGLPGGGFATCLTDSGTVTLHSDTGAQTATLDGHTDPVCALACGPAGEVVSGSSGGTVKVWVGRECTHSVKAHVEAVAALATSPHGFLVSGSSDTTAKVWGWDMGECVATLGGHAEAVLAVCVLDNGDVVTGSGDESVRVWARGSWTCTAVHVQPAAANSLMPIPGGGYAVGGGDTWTGDVGFACLWRGGVEKCRLPVDSLVTQFVAMQGGTLAVCTLFSVYIMHNGEWVGWWPAPRVRSSALTSGRLAVFGAGVANVFRFVRPSRVTTIRVLVAAWVLHGGSPLAACAGGTPAAVLARTLSLRRFCRCLGTPGAEQVVEPFARDIVGFM